MRIILSMLLLICLGIPNTFGQSAAMKHEARTLAKHGKELMGEARYKEAAAKFARAIILDGKNTSHQIELARAWFFDKDYKACEEVLEPLLASKNTPIAVYQIMGNCLDEQGKDFEAMSFYRKGLEKHPESGMLYMEMGILEFSRGRDSLALLYWEEGLRLEPLFPGNYYLAAKLRFEMQDYAWTSVYAETFINLEIKGDRVKEMSKLLYELYARARKYDYAGEFKWRFEGNNELHPLAETMNQAFTSILRDTAWQPDIESLERSRRFSAFYIPRYSATNANTLYLWHQKLARVEHFEAYNYWLFYDSNPPEFFTWFEKNEKMYDDFESWYLRNPFRRQLKKSVVRE